MAAEQLDYRSHYKEVLNMKRYTNLSATENLLLLNTAETRVKSVSGLLKTGYINKMMANAHVVCYTETYPDRLP